MSKLIFLFCVAFVAKASDATRSPFKFENASPAITSDTSSTNSQGFSSVDELAFLLLRKINTAQTKLSTAYLKLQNFTIKAEKVLPEKLSSVIDHVIANMTNIFKQMNDSAAEYYKEKNAASCVSPIENLYQQLTSDNKHKIADKAALCSLQDFDEMLRHLKMVDAIYSKIGDELERLRSLASTYNKDACFEVKDKLENLDVDQQLKQMATEFYVAYKTLFVNMKNIDSCWHPRNIIKKYKEDVATGFLEFKKCVNRGK